MSGASENYPSTSLYGESQEELVDQAQDYSAVDYKDYDLSNPDNDPGSVDHAISYYRLALDEIFPDVAAHYKIRDIPVQLTAQESLDHRTTFDQLFDVMADELNDKQKQAVREFIAQLAFRQVETLAEDAVSDVPLVGHVTKDDPAAETKRSLTDGIRQRRRQTLAFNTMDGEPIDPGAFYTVEIIRQQPYVELSATFQKAFYDREPHDFVGFNNFHVERPRHLGDLDLYPNPDHAIRGEHLLKYLDARNSIADALNDLENPHGDHPNILSGAPSEDPEETDLRDVADPRYPVPDYSGEAGIPPEVHLQFQREADLEEQKRRYAARIGNPQGQSDHRFQVDAHFTTALMNDATTLAHLSQQRHRVRIAATSQI